MSLQKLVHILCGITPTLLIIGIVLVIMADLEIVHETRPQSQPVVQNEILSPREGVILCERRVVRLVRRGVHQVTKTRKCS